MKSNQLSKLRLKRNSSISKLARDHSQDLRISHTPTDALVLLNISCGGHKSCSLEDLYFLFEPDHFDLLDVIMKPGLAFTTIIFKSECESTRFKLAYDNLFLDRLDKHCFIEYAHLMQNLPKENDFKKRDYQELGLFLHKNFMEQQTQTKLVEDIKTLDFKKVKDRYVMHFGYEFNYTINRLTDIGFTQNHPLFIQNAFEIVNSKLGIPFDQATVSYYPIGSGIPSHVDSHCSFENEIAILNLNSTVEFEFKNHVKSEAPIKVSMDKGDLCLIKDEIRYLWKHAIKERKLDLIFNDKTSKLEIKQRSDRYSVVFRRNKISKECSCFFDTVCDKKWKVDQIT